VGCLRARTGFWCAGWLAVLAGAAFAACGDGAPIALEGVDAGVDADFDAPNIETSMDGPVSNASGDLLILSVSDWRGQLEPVLEVDSNGIEQAYGGLETLATYFARDRAGSRSTLVLTTGDAVGATPLLSSASGDEAAVKGLNLLGVAADTLGSHDFDVGPARLAELLALATFKVTSTNVKNVHDLGPKPVAPFLLLEVGQGDARLKVAVLGLTNPDLAELQFPEKLGNILVLQPLATVANKSVDDARLIGADIVVALAHVGAARDTGGHPSGPLLDLAGQLRGVDVLLGGATDRALSTVVGGMLVVQNRSKGRSYGRIRLHVDKGRVTATESTIVDARARYVASTLCDAGAACSCPTPCADLSLKCNSDASLCEREAVEPDPNAKALVLSYKKRLPAVLDTPIARVSAPFPRDGTTEQTEETALGNLVSDALRARYKAQIALVPAGRLRASLPSSYTPTTPRPDATSVLVGDIQAAFAPGDSAVVRRLTGQLLWEVLERSVSKAPAKDAGFLQVSGIKVTCALSSDAGSRVLSVTLDDGSSKNIPKSDPTPYLVAMVDVMSAGGADYPMLVESVPTLSRDLLTDILADYVKAKSPITPAVTFTRIVQLP